MNNYIDQLGRTLHLSSIPKRIVSLVPSITELISDLSDEPILVGCTKFCIHPKGLKKRLTLVGGTKNVSIPKVSQLNPDLIIANQEENDKNDIIALAKDFPVWVSRVSNLKESYEMIRQLSKIINKQRQVKKILLDHEGIFNGDIKPCGTVAYIIWQNPIMTVGGDTFINDILRKSGYANVFSNRMRYPEVSVKDLARHDPDYIFLASEPFPFSNKHLKWWQEQLPNKKIILVDGEFFSWYGSRITHKRNYLSKLQLKTTTA